MAGAGCCCATGLWVTFSERRLVTFEEERVADEKFSSRQLMRASASCSPSTMHLSTNVSPLLDVWHWCAPERTKQFSYIAQRTKQVIKSQNNHPHINYLGYRITPQQTHALIDRLAHLNDCYSTTAKNKHMQCSPQAQTQGKETYNQPYPVR